MNNLFEYINWRGDLALYQAANRSVFNEIDGLILARLSYAPFDKIGLQREISPVILKNAATALIELPDLEQHVLLKDDIELLKEVASVKNGRFGDLRLVNYVDQIDVESQMQFSAVTFLFGDDVSEDSLSYIAFRGTDNTLIGWKEDFNMSFITPVPAQSRAVEYVENVCKTLPGKFILGGHSKGGNLAVYAAAFCSEDVQDKIVGVYNFDGPGFDEQILGTEGYRRISARIRTFVPQSSIVGMLLEHEENYTIIQSSQITGFLQHDIYSWLIDRDKLLYLESVTNSSKFVDGTLKAWVADMTDAQREILIDTMYKVLSETNSQTLEDLKNNWVGNAKIILSSIKNLDKETRDTVFGAFKLLFKSSKHGFLQLSQVD